MLPVGDLRLTRCAPSNPAQLALLGVDALVSLASGIAFYVVISRAAGASLLGQYSVVIAWLILFQSVGSFGIPELLMRELGRFTNERGRYLGAGLIVGLAVSCAAVPAMILIAWLTSYEVELKQAIALAALGLPASMLTNLVRSGLISSRRNGLILLSRVVEFLICSGKPVLLLNSTVSAADRAPRRGRTLQPAGALAASSPRDARCWWPGRTFCAN